MGDGAAPERNWRTRGWVLVALGLFLVLFMGAIAWNLYPSIAAPGVEAGGTTYTGTAEDTQFVLGIFALVIGFGLICTANGAFMIATGRRSRALTAILLVIFAILMAIGWAIRKKWIV